MLRYVIIQEQGTDLTCIKELCKSIIVGYEKRIAVIAQKQGIVTEFPDKSDKV